jgi:hypothetical protein
LVRKLIAFHLQLAGRGTKDVQLLAQNTLRVAGTALIFPAESVAPDLKPNIRIGILTNDLPAIHNDIRRDGCRLRVRGPRVVMSGRSRKSGSGKHCRQSNHSQKLLHGISPSVLRHGQLIDCSELT